MNTPKEKVRKINDLYLMNLKTVHSRECFWPGALASSANSARRSAVNRVDIFQFEDERAFLKAILSERRGRKQTNSLRQLTKRAGFKSPATLSMILSGKRAMTLEAAEKLSSALDLSGRRRRYLLALARLSNSKTEIARSQAKAEMIRLRSAIDENDMDTKHYRCLSEWHYVALYVLIGQDDFKLEPLALAERLGRGMTAPQVVEALKDLESVGLIRPEGDRYIQCSGAISTKDDVKDTAVFSYHKKMIELSGEALNLPMDAREFNGLSIAIPKEQLPVLKKKLRNFRKELNEYFSQFKGAAEVFQINLHVFPLTQSKTEKLK